MDIDVCLFLLDRFFYFFDRPTFQPLLPTGWNMFGQKLEDKENFPDRDSESDEDEEEDILPIRYKSLREPIVPKSLHLPIL
jgi:hypothetical protein